MSIREPIYLDPSGYIKGLNKAERATDRYADKQKRNFRQTGDAAEKSAKKTGSSFKKIGRSAKLWIAGAATAAFAGFITLLRKGSDLAQSVEETASKFKTVLGPSIEDANKFIEENATLMGLSNRQAQEMIATTDAIAQGFGFEGDAAADFSQEVVKLAGDLQSFNDVPIARTQNAVVTALSGEREALKTLGIVVRQAEVDQRALANTGLDSADALDQQQKATATLQLITEKAGVAVGDLERTQNSAANRSRQVWAELGNIAEIMSVKLLPAINGGLNKLEPFVDTIKDWVEVPLSEEIEDEQVELNVLVSRITAANTKQKERNALIQSLQSEYPNFLKNLDAEKVTNGELASRLNEINDAYIRKIAIQKQQESLSDAIEDQSNAYRNQEIAVQRIRKEIAQLNQYSDINIGLTGRSIQQIMGEARSELGGNTFTSDALFRLNKMMDSYTDATENAADAEKQITNETEILNRVLDKYNDKVRQVETSNNKTKDALLQQRDAIQKQISKYKEGSTQYGIYAESLASVNQKINDLSAPDPSSAQQTIDYIKKTRKEYELFLALQRQGYTDIGSAGIERLFKDFASSDIIGSHIDKAVSDVEQYNQALTKANNERQAGNISAEQYQRRVNEATETYYNQLQQIYNIVKDQLSPEQQEVFEDLFGYIKEGEEQTGELKTNLDDIADTVDSVVNLADAFADIGENAKDSLRGISSVLRGVQSIKELADDAGGLSNLLSSGGGFLGAAVPAIGIAGGIASFGSGILSNSASKEEQKRISELSNEMRSLKRAIAENTKALLEEGLVGAGISKSERDEANLLIGQLGGITSSEDFSKLLGTDFSFKFIEDQVVKGFIDSMGLKDLFNQLSEIDIDGFDKLTGENFIKLLDVIGGENATFEDLNKAIQEFINGTEGASTILGKLEKNAGSFGNSLEGAITRLNTTTKLGLDEGEAFDRFISDVIGLVGKDNKLTKILEKIATAESEEQRKKLANDMFNVFQQNADLLGPDLTGSDLQEVIDVILGQSDPAGEDTGAEASIPDKYTRSTQVANSITEIQANEIVFFLERIEAWTRSLAANFGDDTAISITRSGGYATSFNIPIPLPVKIVEGGFDAEKMSRLIGPYPDSSGPSSIGPITIQGGISESNIDDITREINRKMKQEVRGSRF